MRATILAIWGDRFKRGILLFLVNLMLIQPLSGIIPDIAVAATTTGTLEAAGDQTCLATVKAFYDGGTASLKAAATPDTDPGEAPFEITANLTAIAANKAIPQEIRDTLVSPDRITKILAAYPIGVTYYKTPAGNEIIATCSTAISAPDFRLFDPYLMMDVDTLSLFGLLKDASPKIVFASSRDKYAVFGEPCTGGLKGLSTSWTSSQQACPGFTSEDDLMVSNGQWDAPRADVRIMETLLYLVTPVEQGGAGREYIHVKQITDPSGTNPIASSLADSQAANTSLTQSILDGVTATPDSGTNTYDIDINDNSIHPTKIASSLDIDAIDQARTSVKTVKHKLFGDDVSYTYQAPVPIQTAWQSADGQKQSPPPNVGSLSMLASSRFLANVAIIQMLNQYGLGDIQFDASTMEISNFGDIASAVGRSLLDQVLGTPGGSLNGWDLTSTLESVGRAYLNTSLGLLPGSLSQGDDYESITNNIGRTVIEKALSLPPGSLDSATGTSSDIVESLGRRYLEDTVLRVSQGTLTPVPSTVGELLKRLGEGRLEYAFKLPAQSMRTDDYTTLRQSSFKAGLLFPKATSTPGDNDFGMEDYVSTQLSLAYTDQTDSNGNKSGHTTYGFSQGDFTHPLTTLEQNPTESQLTKFKQMIGDRLINATIGSFQASGLSEQISKDTSVISSRKVVLSPTADKLNEYSSTLPANVAKLVSPDRTTVPEGSTQSFLDMGASYLPESGAVESFGWCDASNSTNVLSFFAPPPTGSNHLGPISGSIRIGCVIDNSQYTFQGSSFNLWQQIDTVVGTTPDTKHWVFTGNTDLAPKQTSYEDANGVLNDAGKNRYLQDALLFYSNPTNWEAQDPTYTSTIKQEVTALPDSADKNVLLSRLAMANDLAARQKGADLFDFNNDLVKGKTGSTLDTNLTAWLNLLTVHPAPSTTQAEYDAQYNNKAYNGWYFLIDDIGKRYACLQIHGLYQFTDNSYSCTVPADPEPQTDFLLQKIQSIQDALHTVIDRGSGSDPVFLANGKPSGTALAGQSAMSAVIGLPGQSGVIDANGRYHLDGCLDDNGNYQPASASVCANANNVTFNHDPMRALLTPGITQGGQVPLGGAIANGDLLMQEIGRLIAAKSFTSDKTAQASIAYGLKTNLKSFDQAAKNLLKIGIGNSLFQTTGLSTTDFSRIFQLSSSDEVFGRVGKEELLRVLWNKTGLDKAISNSAQAQKILKQIDQIVQKIDFYQTRVAQLPDLIDTLKNNIEILQIDLKIAKPAVAGALSTIFDNPDLPKLSELNAAAKKAGTGDSAQVDIKRLQAMGNQYEQYLGEVQTAVGSVGELAGLTKDDYDALMNTYHKLRHVLQELAAGKQLPAAEESTSPDKNKPLGTPNPANSNDACTDASALVSVLTAPKKAINQALKGKGHTLTRDLASYGVLIASCKLDTSLGLPDDSMYQWYLAGNAAYDGGAKDNGGNGIVWKKGERTLDSFEVSIGYADQVNRGKLPSGSDMSKVGNLSRTQVSQLKDIGQKLIEVSVINKLIQAIPGIGPLLKKAGITPQDLVDLLQGNGMPIAAKIGGAKLDQALGLPPGTGKQLIYPTCTLNDGTVHACDKEAGQPNTDPDNIRRNVIAQAGLKKLGLEVPNFPKYFDMNAGSGNLMENWGNATLSENLGLAANSFIGKITDKSSPIYSKNLGAANSTQSLQTALGLHSASSDLLWGIENVIASQKDLPPDIFTILDDIDASINDSATKSTLDELANLNKGFYANLPELGAATLAADDYARLYAPSGPLSTMWDYEYFNDDIQKQVRTKIYDTFFRPLLPQGELPSAADIATALTKSGLPSQHPTLDEYTKYFSSSYLASVTFFKSHTDAFTATNSIDPELWYKFLWGQIPAEQITKQVGNAAVVSGQINKLITKAEDKLPWLKTADDGLKALTSGNSNCPSGGVGLGDLLQNSLGSNFASNRTDSLSACGEALAALDANTILTGSDFAGFRGFLFDHYLGHIFSTKVEENLNLQPGTFRQLAVNPSKAQQILTTQGIIMVANRVFGKADPKTPDQIKCAAKINPNAIDTGSSLSCKMQGWLRASFLKGYCDSETGMCTTNFNTSRATAEFQHEMNAEIDKQLDLVSTKYLGFPVTRSELDGLIQGDMHVFDYIGIQETVTIANKQLLKSASAKNNPNASKFLINFNDVRDAAGYGVVLSPAEQAAAISQADFQYQITTIAGTSWYDSALQSYQKDHGGSNPTTAEDLYIVDKNAYAAYTADNPYSEEGKVLAEQGALLQAQEVKEQAAKQLLQYKMYDIVAFMADKNIPPDFSRRILNGTDREKGDTIAEFLLNSYADKNSSFKKLLNSIGLSNPADAVQFAKDLVQVLARNNTSQGAATTMMTNSVEFNALKSLDAKAQDWLATNVFHTSVTKIPSGLILGTVAWATTGFKWTGFGANYSFKIGNTTNVVPGLGSVLATAGRQILYDWGDKLFHFKAGTTAQIAKGIDAMIKFRQAASVARVGYTVEEAALIAKGSAEIVAGAGAAGSAILEGGETGLTDLKNATDLELQGYADQGAGMAEKSADAAKAQATMQAEFEIIKEVVLNIFSKQLSQLDSSFGLPQGTMAQVAGIVATYIAAYFGLAINPVTMGFAFAFLAYTLIFGVVSVTYTFRETGDGYYPFYKYGTAGGSAPQYGEVVTSDEPTGEFDPTNTASYQAGLIEASRGKVIGLMQDLLLMPSSLWAKVNRIDPTSLWIPQVLTWGDSSFDPTADPRVSFLMNQPAPWESPSGLGYGSADKRCAISLDTTKQSYNCVQDSGFRAGYYPALGSPSFIHLSW